jgi:hypothetical protein
MRFGVWNVRRIYRADSLKAVVEGISKYKLDLVGMKKVTKDGSGIENMRFSMERGMRIVN